MPRQAVHKLPVRLRPPALGELMGDLIPPERLQPLLRLLLLPHAHPRVRDQDIRVLDCLFGDGRFGQGAWVGDALGGGEDDGFDVGGDAVAGRGGDGDVDAHFDRGDGEVEEDVVAVAYPGDFETFEAEGGGGGGGGEGLVDGLEVGDGLKGVEIGGEGVDYGDRGGGC